jgi:hypothetical protein
MVARRLIPSPGPNRPGQEVCDGNHKFGGFSCDQGRAVSPSLARIECPRLVTIGSASAEIAASRPNRVSDQRSDDLT